MVTTQPIEHARTVLGEEVPVHAARSRPRSDQRSIARDAEGGDDRHHEIDEEGDAEEEEGLLRPADGDVGFAHEIVERDDRDQRRVLEEDQPEIGDAGQRQANEVGQDDENEGGKRPEAEGVGDLVLASRDVAEGAKEHLARIGGEDEAERDHAGEEAADA